MTLLKELVREMMLKEAEMAEADGECMRARREMILQTLAYKDCDVPFNKKKAESLTAAYCDAVAHLTKVREEFDRLHQRVLKAPVDPRDRAKGRTFAGTWSL